MHFFGVRSWAFSFGSSSFAELRNKGQGRGGKARGSGAFGGACFWGGFLYSFLMGRVTHPSRRLLCDNRTRKVKK